MAPIYARKKMPKFEITDINLVILKKMILYVSHKSNISAGFWIAISN